MICLRVPIMRGSRGPNYEGLKKVLIHSKITLFGGQNLHEIRYLLRELLNQLPIGQIDSYFGVTLEYH